MDGSRVLARSRSASWSSDGAPATVELRYDAAGDIAVDEADVVGGTALALGTVLMFGADHGGIIGAQLIEQCRLLDRRSAGGKQQNRQYQGCNGTTVSLDKAT